MTAPYTSEFGPRRCLAAMLLEPKSHFLSSKPLNARNAHRERSANDKHC
jgi:hypothetical protein